ncbi:MAG: penicillin-insensitive murein endopeptidase [Thermoleophilia bacterium]|nr:penicillin-insensitive murein endopeptidase [Thermoleophilia bacterium]
MRLAVVLATIAALAAGLAACDVAREERSASPPVSPAAPAAAGPEGAPAAPAAKRQRAHPAPLEARIRWRRSRPIGLPYAGRLLAGVRLPAEGRTFFTWDPVRRRSPNRSSRRFGTDGLVRITLAVVRSFAAVHPNAPRVGIGDLSRRRGGPFRPKHASHQNGLDVDVYYPRKDGKERPARTAAQVDRRLAQQLVDRFVAAGAAKVFVGPNVGLRGPKSVVQVLPNHDDHLHARIPPGRA